MTTEEKLDRLAGIVESLAASAVHHDNQIEAHDQQIGKILTILEIQATRMAEQKERMDQLIREWQAYLRTIRPQ